MYTYDELTLSDLHKDARGTRPRSEYFWARWNESNDDGKQAIWDNLIGEKEDSYREEWRRDAEAIEAFKAFLDHVIHVGAGDRETALRWMTQGETFYTHQCVEHWVWNKGILFTDYGRKLVNELMEIVIFEEYV